jgi:hypothetical protein
MHKQDEKNDMGVHTTKKKSFRCNWLSVINRILWSAMFCEQLFAVHFLLPHPCCTHHGVEVAFDLPT